MVSELIVQSGRAGLQRLRKKGVVAALRRQRTLKTKDIWRGKPAATYRRTGFSAASEAPPFRRQTKRCAYLCKQAPGARFGGRKSRRLPTPGSLSPWAFGPRSPMKNSHGWRRRAVVWHVCAPSKARLHPAQERRDVCSTPGFSTLRCPPPSDPRPVAKRFAPRFAPIGARLSVATGPEGTQEH